MIDLACQTIPDHDCMSLITLYMYMAFYGHYIVVMGSCIGLWRCSGYMALWCACSVVYGACIVVCVYGIS